MQKKNIFFPKLNLSEAVFVPADFEVPDLGGGGAAGLMENKESSRSKRKCQQLSLAGFIFHFLSFCLKIKT